jgi:hypothetical protein
MRRFAVLTAVEFDDEAMFQADEVEDVTATRCLTPEVKTAAAPFTEVNPQLDLLRREGLAKLSRAFVRQHTPPG